MGECTSQTVLPDPVAIPPQDVWLWVRELMARVDNLEQWMMARIDEDMRHESVCVANRSCWLRR